MRDLQQEFNLCLDSKKVTLKEYVKQKNLMKESLAVQSNVDHLFSQSPEDKLKKNAKGIVLKVVMMSDHLA